MYEKAQFDLYFTLCSCKTPRSRKVHFFFLHIFPRVSGITCNVLGCIGTKKTAWAGFRQKLLRPWRLVSLMSCWCSLGVWDLLFLLWAREMKSRRQGMVLGDEGKPSHSCINHIILGVNTEGISPEKKSSSWRARNDRQVLIPDFSLGSGITMFMKRSESQTTSTGFLQDWSKW